MPKLTIDGRETEVPKGTTVIRAARDLGIKIPHFCWHPELSVAANCRMCLVEIEKMPKLMPACQVEVGEGMVVRTDTPKVREARRAVMEFLLLDHPVDCPICDQAGECKLQDYYMAHDLKSTRLWSEEAKVRGRKRTVFGPHIVSDSERCVMCTRCVRFCEEVVKDPVLTTVQRGDHKMIAVAQGRTLDHAYSLMTANVCPVGALTSRDFRFRKRVWFLTGSELICPGCATGCNAFLDHCDGIGYRLRPRENPAVNRCWLCDDGVLAYGLHNERRVRSASIGRGGGKPASIADALAAAVKALTEVSRGKAAAILSAEHTCEENHALIAFAKEALGVERFFVAGRAEGTGDDLLRHADRNPNRAGVRAVLGRDPEPIDALIEAVGPKGITAAIALGSDAASAAPVAAALAKLGTLVAFAARSGAIPDAATIVLPTPSFAETAGTYVNAKGLAQRFARAVTPSGDTIEVPVAVTRIARRMEIALPFSTTAEVTALIEGVLAPPAEAEGDAAGAEGVRG